MPFCAPTWAIPAPINPAPNTVKRSIFFAGADEDKCLWIVDNLDAAIDAAGAVFLAAMTSDERAIRVREGSMGVR